MGGDATTTRVQRSNTEYVKNQQICSLAAHTAWNLYQYHEGLEEASEFQGKAKKPRPWNKKLFVES